MNDVIRDFEKMLKRLIGEDIEVVLSLQPDAGSLLADPYQIEQVIMNLVINARDAMPNGGKLFIETSRFEAPAELSLLRLGVVAGTYVQLVVSDTGTGMPPEVKEHIFEPFFTTKEPGKGTDLASPRSMGSSRSAAEQSPSRANRGTAAPLECSFPPSPPMALISKPAPELRNFSGHETILMAEDEAGLRKYVRHILERKGYVVLEASNGNQALETAQVHRGPIHLLLTDLVMPEMGGVDLVGEFAFLRPTFLCSACPAIRNGCGARES